MDVVRPEDVTPAWLTRILKEERALEVGDVVGVDVRGVEERRLSTIAKLTARYAEGSRGSCPRSLLLKSVRTEVGGESFGRSEVDYHRRDYVGASDVPLPRSYYGAFSAEEGRYSLLMDDLSETHENAKERVPTLEHGLALAEALAAMHAVHWRVPPPSAAAIERYVGVARDGMAPMLASCRTEIDPAWHAAILTHFAEHPLRMVERARDPVGFTLVHGDVNPTNVLAPRVGERPIYLIDRQPFDWSLITWLGAGDLAYMMVPWWEPEARRSFERPILRRYHEQLLRRGVEDYPLDRLFEDYRLCVAQCVYVAAEWCRNPSDLDAWKWLWLAQLRRAMAACLEWERVGQHD